MIGYEGVIANCRGVVQTGTQLLRMGLLMFVLDTR